MRYFIFILLLLLPATSFAAELHLDQQTNAIRVGDTFATTFFLDTGTDVINAMEGSLQYSSMLSLVEIRLQGSLIPLWISSPVETGEGAVSFAGVLPGGYQGKGNIFTLVFKALQKGTANISFGKDTKAYENDGKGTAAKLFLSTDSFSVGDSSGTPQSVGPEEDIVPPESFTPVITSGEPFGLHGSVLIFMTQDKNSGISHYDMARSYYQNAKESSLLWEPTQSPYALVQGDATRYLYIRAVDNAGNTRIAVVPPQEFSIIAFLFSWWPLLVLLVSIGVILFFRKSKG